MDKTNNNQVLLTGVLTEPFSFSHELPGEKFYISTLFVERLSGQHDLIPVMFSDKLIDVTQNYSGMCTEIHGQLRSHNLHDDSNRKLLLYIYAQNFTFFGEQEHIDYKNEVVLNGYVAKLPVYRKTPLKKEITNILLAVNRPYPKADYIPCILWGTNAKLAESFQPGTQITVRGRIQSREYIKNDENTIEKKTTYELSVSKLEPTGTIESENKEAHL